MSNIAKYFLVEPDLRTKLRLDAAKEIVAGDRVIFVLGWSSNKATAEAYEAGLDLLSSCSEIKPLKEAFEYLELWRDNDDLKLENDWDLLIRSIGYASRIPAKQRLDLIAKISKSVFPFNSRLIKTAIVDTLLLFVDDVDVLGKGAIAEMLSKLSSVKEWDVVVQNYAKNALQDLYGKFWV